MGKYQGYEKYKSSGVEWLGDIPEHWEFRRIKFLCRDIISGPFGSSLTKDTYTQSGYKIYGQEQVIVDDFSIGDYYISKEKYKEMIRYNVSPGDVLVSCVGTFGKIAVVPENAEKGIINPRLIKLNLDKQRIAPNYFGILLSSEVSFFQFDMFSRGGTMGVVNIGTLSEIELPIPPIDEQESIAHFLDRKTSQIDTLIAKKAALLEKLDEKRTALISHAVTKGLDPNVPMKDSGVEWLGDIPEHWDCLSLHLRYSIELGKMLDQRKISGDFLVKYLRNVDVQWDFINQNDLPEMDINPSEYERYLVKEGDLLVCEGGESGRSAIVQSIESIVGFQKAIHRLRPISKEEISRYLLYTFYYVSKLGVFVAEGNPNTITHLTSEKLKLYRLPRPPRIEQQLIIKYLDEKTADIDRQKAKVKEAIELLKEYRTALITNAVTGKIDVRQVDRV